MNFTDLGVLICLDETPHFLGIFDFSVAPPLLYYSYIPIIILSLAIGLFIFFNDRKSIQSKLFLGVVVSFSAWILNILVQWVASYHTILMFAWQLTVIFEIALFILTVYFSYVFIYKKDISLPFKLSLWLLGVSVLALVPTTFNIISYDINNCEGVIGSLWNIVYTIEPIFVLLIIYFGIDASLKEKDVNKRKQIKLSTFGLSFFLLVFFLSNFYGEITGFYEFNFWGPVGMLVFIFLLAYMIVKFQAFNIKLLATQVLVWGMTFLVGAQFFFIKNKTNYFLNGFTFIASLFFGQWLIQSVKNEVYQRETLERINNELKALIQQRESLVHLITHKVKGSFTRSKFLFAEMLQGSFGPLSPELTNMTKRVFESDVEGIATVDLVLNASNMQKGTVKFDLKPLDFKQLLTDVANDKKVLAQNKGLEFNLDIKEGEYNLSGDVLWLKEVVVNLIQNSILYTPKGHIDISLEKNSDKMLLCVKDTGVGINEEDKKNLFTEGGRGKDSIKINVDSTGYGLYTVKIIVDAHKGRIWAESEGEGKGSTFFVELPLIS